MAPDTGAPHGPNAVTATLEQALYRGFMVHYYLRLPGGEPLIAFQQNTGNGVAIGLEARAGGAGSMGRDQQPAGAGTTSDPRLR